MRTSIVVVAKGVIFGSIQVGLSILLGIIFGLGFSKWGAWFVTTFLLEPGITLAKLFVQTFDGDYKNYFFAINFVFYSMIGIVFFGLAERRKKSNKEIKCKRND